MIIQGHQFEKYLSEKDIDSTVREMALQIDEVYKGQKLVLVGVLNGAFMFVSDLVKSMTLDAEIHFVKYSSYQGSQSTGQVKKELDLDMNLSDRHVLIVEDIIDTGNTLEKIFSDFTSKNPASLKIASLLLKPEAYQKSIPVDFIGKEIPNDFVIGYGMDIDGKGRGLKDIYSIAQS